MKKKFLSNIAYCAVFFLATLITTNNSHAQRGQFSTIVVEQQSGKILQATEEQELAYPASITKVMTLYMLFERLSEGKITMDTLIPVSKQASMASPTKLNLRQGDVIPVDTAIRAMVVRSANDVATAVGEYLGGGDEEEFARLMTRKARQIGMAKTTFQNASGLPDNQQITTAFDLAQLGRRMIQDFPQYYHYFSLRSFEFEGNTYGGHNRVLDMFAGADGMKTGYINLSGYNLLTSAEIDNKRVVAVVLGGQTGAIRDRIMVDLLSKYTKRADDYTNEANLSKNSKPITMVNNTKPVKNMQKAKANDDFMIQVGSFSKKQDANERIKHALNFLPTSIKRDADYEVSKIQNNKKVFFRAMISSLTQKNAQAACLNLKKKQIECVIRKS